MNSESFFASEKGEYYKTRQGVYVINMPLFKENGRNIYKVGYARDNLEKRLKDYRTAYGPVPFIIEAIMEVPEKVFHKRPNFARLSETRIHKTLIKIDKNNLVMRDAETDKQLGEWFYNIREIISVLKGLRHEYENDDEIKEQVKKWDFTYNKFLEDVPPYLDLYDAKKVKSGFSKLVVKDRSSLSRNKGKKLDENYTYVKDFFLSIYTMIFVFVSTYIQSR